MHPNERPASIDELREMLFGSTLLSGPLPQAGAAPPWEPSWGELFRQYRPGVGTAAAGLVLAVVVRGVWAFEDAQIRVAPGLGGGVSPVLAHPQTGVGA